MQVYEELIRNNLERFLAGAFPIAKKLLGEPHWDALVRACLEHHGCASPYFREIGQEFLSFLQSDAAPKVPDFLPELCHYERVPTVLRRAERPSPAKQIDPQGELLTQSVAVSPLAWPLAYRYPVHQISAESRADEVQPQPTWLIAWRRSDDSVGVMASNALTHRLLALLHDGHTGQRALDRLAEELPGVTKARLDPQGAAILARLRDAGVLLGTTSQL